nr:glycosyltransferase [Candidatus Levybacteria bacterium]
MNLKSSTVLIVTHVYTTGPSFRLEEYLQKKVKNLIFIGHPFSYAKDTRSFLRVYKNGNLIKEKKFVEWKGPELFFYLKDIFLTLWWALRYSSKVNYYIGVDNLNVFSGFLLKVIGKVGYLVFYTIDYIPNRFENKILNSIYHFLDRFAVKKSNKVWNLSSIMIDEREKRGVDSKYRNKQIVVPIGTSIPVKSIKNNDRDRYQIVHMGHLLEKQGVEKLIEAMKDVIVKVPKAHLLVVGGGPLETKLKRDVIRFKLQKYVKFTGFVKEFSEVEKMLQMSAIAVAPYLDSKDTYTRYTDPGKPKDYLANGLPVVITKVPQVAYEIEKNKCGIAINDDKKELAKALITLLTNETMLNEFRKNALIMAKKYTWNKIFDKVFIESK